MTKLLQSFEKLIKKCITFLSAVQSQNKNLAALVSSILKLSKDSIKKSNRLYLFKNLF